MQFFKKNYQQSHGSVHETQITMLSELPMKIINQMHFEMFIPALSSNLYLGKFLNSYPEVAQNICCNALSVKHYMSQQAVFEAGAFCHNVYMVEYGMLTYNRAYYRTLVFSSRNQMQSSGSVPVGTWTCEMALWCPWTHCGQLLCYNSTRIVCLDSQKFNACILEAPNSMDSNVHESFRKVALFTVGHVEAQLEAGNEINDMPLEPGVIEGIIDRVRQLSRLNVLRSNNACASAEETTP